MPALKSGIVCVEIASALARNIPVMPVFLGDAPIPTAANLPESIRPLLGLQATRLQRANFETDAKALIDGMVRSIKLARTAPLETLRSSPAALPLIRPRADGRIMVDALSSMALPTAGSYLEPAGPSGSRTSR